MIICYIMLFCLCILYAYATFRSSSGLVSTFLYNIVTVFCPIIIGDVWSGVMWVGDTIILIHICEKSLAGSVLIFFFQRWLFIRVDLGIRSTDCRIWSMVF